ncbi:MAG TPA: hypothetical protein VM865_07980 [Acidobacteriaceae bacterium]|nr:hypothetical protein [Acidobacteriaceae bacterium]
MLILMLAPRAGAPGLHHFAEDIGEEGGEQKEPSDNESREKGRAVQLLNPKEADEAEKRDEGGDLQGCAAA